MNVVRDERPVSDLKAVHAGGGLTARAPRSTDASAPRSESASENPKTIKRPWWNGAAIKCGKNVRPVSTARSVAVSDASFPVCASRCCIGVSPRNAAKSEATGGNVAICRALASGTPCADLPSPFH